MPRLKKTLELAIISQLKCGYGAIARGAFLAVAPIFLLDCMAAESTTTFSTGLSGDQILVPYISTHIDKKWAIQQWELSAVIDGRLQHNDGLGDASFSSEWHTEALISTLTKFEIDASYEFERDKTDFITHEHGLSGDLGLTHYFDGFTLKTDFGIEANLFEDTTESGFPSLDRSREDNIDVEIATRFTGNSSPLLNPFFEIAYVARDYMINTGRDFAGLDLVLGTTLSQKNLSGDVGFFFGSRRGNSVAQKLVMGPQVDLDWTIEDHSSIKFALGAGLGQETSGTADLFQTHSMRLEAVHKIADDLKLSLIFEALRENLSSGKVTELTPELKFDWSNSSGFGAYGSAALTYEKTKGIAAKLNPHFDIGLKWTW